jgi:predicted DNA-binding transcriptional regulator YafY
MPAGVDPGAFVRDDPLAYGEDHPVEARVLVDASRAGWVVEQLGEDAVVARHDDGSVEVALLVVNRDAFRSWVIDLLDHAEVLAPAELRDDIVRWLTAIEGRRP